MLKRCVIVLDVGKTNAKVSLWDGSGRQLSRGVRPNEVVHTADYRALDVPGIEQWLAETLRECARQADVGVIVPVGHGAAAALVRNGTLFAAPMDYEQEVGAQERELYVAQRDDFRETGSPLLPQGMNLGLQLHSLERSTGPWPDDVRILPWPQFWAWRLSAVMASEVTSLGCHTDLWRPLAGDYSRLAQQRGWDRRFAPLRRAAEVLSFITPQWAARTGLPRDCAVLCGLHDSNAALLAARGHADINEHDSTVLSTGTWFVAMRSPTSRDGDNPLTLQEHRDCLINVDVEGRPVPSSRFMGGREAEAIANLDTSWLTADYDPHESVARLSALLERRAAVLPSFARGCGPFPRAVGKWSNKPEDPSDQGAIAGLYLALMADECLNLIGSRDRLAIEGRFAEAVMFTRTLATLRPEQKLFVSHTHDDVPYGALRLIDPTLPAGSQLTPVEPLKLDLTGYAAWWRAQAGQSAA